FLPSRGEHIFGVWTRPTTAPNGIAAILLVGGIYGLSIGRNRLSVRLARTLASCGYHVMRLDLHGSGESTGEVRDLLDLTFLDPFVELAGRRVPMLLCYGDEPMRLDFERASEGPLSSLLDDESNLVEVHLGADRLHGFVTLSAQERLFDLIQGWLDRVGLPP